jgi:hypothetical protein
VAGTDWGAWHADYADPASALSQRLAVVQAQIARWLDRTRPRPVVVTSVCAGDGRDLLGGLLGNVSDEDAGGTIAALSGLCAPGATVVWTRHRREPDLTPAIRGWFTAAGYSEQSFTAPVDTLWSVGVHRLVGLPRPLGEGRRLFSFVR